MTLDTQRTLTGSSNSEDGGREDGLEAAEAENSTLNAPQSVEVSSPSSRVLATAISLLWIVVICVGYWHFSASEGRPGLTAEHPANFPRNSALVTSDTGYTLLMFIHPKCPCTSASLNELAVLSTRCGGKLNAIAVFVKPDQAPAGWERTDYWQRAQRIPGVRVVLDNSGREAKTFGAQTSGETLLYNRDGELVFSGGITGGRGHEGDNQGLDGLTGFINNTNTRCMSINAYGCALNGPTEDAEKAQGTNK